MALGRADRVTAPTESVVPQTSMFGARTTLGLTSSVFGTGSGPVPSRIITGVDQTTGAIGDIRPLLWQGHQLVWQGGVLAW
jgi:hypothetical protein